MSRKLEGKIAIVTGGTSGIGLATAKRFASEGAHVIVTGRRQAELDAAVSAIGNATSIRVDTLSPGSTKTPGLVNLAGPDAARQQGMLDAMAAQIPMGRVGDPDEIAKAAVFLASDDSSFVNGIELFVDGGQAQI